MTQRIKIFTCNICGEVYLGEEIPKTCPFCGVHNKNISLGHVWKDKNKDLVLSEISKKNIEKALEIELSNTAFYKCISEKIDNTEVALMFKGLFKVEREHASVFKKMLGLKEVQDVKEECTDNAEEMIEASHAREDRAVKFYLKALEEAQEPRVKEVLEAIMETEKDHLELDEAMKEKIKS